MRWRAQFSDRSQRQRKGIGVFFGKQKQIRKEKQKPLTKCYGKTLLASASNEKRKWMRWRPQFSDRSQRQKKGIGVKNNENKWKTIQLSVVKYREAFNRTNEEWWNITRKLMKIQNWNKLLKKEDEMDNCAKSNRLPISAAPRKLTLDSKSTQKP